MEGSMVVENLVHEISSLTPDEQDAVKKFVEFLKKNSASRSSSFLTAVDEFVDQHPELLRRLAQ